MPRTLCLIASGLSACAVPPNPPVSREIVWIDAQTEALARRACYDCHSNETEWQAIHRLPLLNSIVEGDVARGRCHMNFSAWDGPNEEAAEAVEVLLDGEMPLPSYTLAHPRARLDDEEIVQLIEGIEATFATDPPLPGEACGDD
ncbi:MAG TPA: hypothetical protein ENK18_15675 [Deltaproteobacteria bacterium]|nr:hypothetical protein [Deltaproteobacteria bacterium]